MTLSGHSRRIPVTSKPTTSGLSPCSRGCARQWRGCTSEDLLREIKFLKEQPQLQSKKEQLVIYVSEVTADLAVKSEEIRKFHVGKE